MFKKFKKWFVLSTYITKKYITWRIHYSFIIQKIFNDFVQYDVFSLCTSIVYKIVNFIIICDNVFAHKSLKLKKICLKTNVKIYFLFFNSSNYNLIKIFFAILKKWMKKHDHIIAKFYDLLLKIFERFLHDVVFAQN